MTFTESFESSTMSMQAMPQETCRPVKINLEAATFSSMSDLAILRKLKKTEAGNSLWGK